MAGYSSRASTISSGALILASDFNNEYDSIIAAMNATTGHSHDSTAGEGKPIALTSAVSGTLPVANGGTGAASHTDGGVLIGKGTAAFANTGVLADGTIIIGDGATNPTTLAAFSSSTGTLAGAYGGTGVANTGKTITLGGSLTTSGAYDSILTATAATAVTLPTTGTLATLAGTESLTNKKLGSLATNGPIYTSGSDGTLNSETSLGVARGGTGVATITTGGLVVGAATSAVTSLNPATAGNSIIDSGTAWTSVAQNWSYRNLFTNGEMKVAQRGTSIAGPTNAYSLDGWKFTNNLGGPGVVTITQSTTVPNATFVNSLKIDVTTVDSSIAAGDQYGLAQYIEGLRCSRIGFGTAAAATVTLSFWFRSDSSDLTYPAVFGGSLFNAGQNRGYAFSFSQTTNATWQKQSITIPGDQSGTWLQTNGNGLGVMISLVCGTTNQGTLNTWTAAQVFGAPSTVNGMNHVNNDFYLTGMQLEVGSVGTPFEFRDYGTELGLCQRYLQRQTRTATGQFIGNAIVNTTTLAEIGLEFNPPMRAAPTFSVSSVGDFFIRHVLSQTDTTGLAVGIAATFEVVGLLATVAAGLTAGQAGHLTFDATANAYIQFSAEL